MLVAVAIVVCTLSLYIDWYCDALNYQFSFATREHLHSITEIPLSQYYHYFTCNGRFLAHSLVQLFCGLAGQTAFAVCNAIAYVCLILLLLKYSGCNWRHGPITVAASLLTLFFCDTSYSPAHQIVYVWMSCTALGFLIVYDHQVYAEKPGWGTALLLFLLGLLCGSGNDTIDMGIGVAIGIDMLCQWRRYGLGRMMLLLGFCIGLCSLCLSPASMHRAQSMYHPPLAMSLYNLVVWLRAFWVFAVVLVVACIRHKVTLRRFISDNWLLVTAMAVMLVFNLFLSVKYNRQLFGIELYSVVLTLRLLRYFHISMYWLAIGTVVVAVQYYMKFTALSVFNSYEMELRRQLIMYGNSPLYIDLNYHNPYVHPTDELTYHDCAEISYHIFSWANHINGDLGIIGKSTTGRIAIDSVTLYPTALAKIEKLEPHNRVVYCGNGVYMMLRMKSHPARFTMHRSIDILGIRRPLSPVEISFDASQHPSTDIYDVFVTTFPYPLMHVDSVTID